MNRFALALVLVIPTGCVSQMGGGGDDDDQTADLAQWNSLSAQYDARRTSFLGPDVQELAAVGNQLFWLDTTSYDPTLDRYDDATAARIAYGFSIGDGDLNNYVASKQLVVTADPSDDPVIYHAYNADIQSTEVGSTPIPKPPGAEWDAYSVDGGTVYIVDTSVEGQTALLSWVPGQQPTQITTLEAAGVQVGEFDNFAVSGTTMIFIESGRIWKLDLGTKQATWLMNMTEVDGTVDFHPDGVMFESATGVMFFDYATNSLVDVTAKINANSFQINATFASAAKWYQGFTRWAKYVLYIGNSGFFAYDMMHDTIHADPLVARYGRHACRLPLPRRAR